MTRGGGSLADLWAFCDETLCRTVAMPRARGQRGRPRARLDPDRRRGRRRLLDADSRRRGRRPDRLPRSAPRRPVRAASLERASAAPSACGRHLAVLARGPAVRCSGRGALNQLTREIRAAAERGVRDRGEHQRRIALVVLRRAARRALEGTQQAGADIRRRGRGLERSAQTALRQRRKALERTRVALRAHDPQRTLERGYARAE